MPSEQLLKELRQALNHLYEPNYLRQSPLATLFSVADRSDTPSTLRRILIEAIESLEPKADEPSRSYAWQVYGILMYRYVEQLSQPEVADQLGFSVRHLRRKERQALEALAALLSRKFGLDSTLDVDTNATIVDQAAVDESTLDHELAWLKQAPQKATADMRETVTGVLDLARGLAGQHGTQLRTAIADDLPHVSADPVVLRQILLNLFSVAVPRASGGQVAFSVRPLNWKVQVQVQCAGCPSGPNPLRSEELASLEITRQLAALSKGELSLAVDTEAFDAMLTLSAIQQVPVLVLDDNSDTLQLLQRYTWGSRYHLVTTRDPEQALSLAERLSPLVIVLDVMMPGVDGWEVLGQLRQNPLTNQIPIVVCTILAQRELALYLGANDFLRKPVTRQAFLTALDRLVEQVVPQPGTESE